MAIDRATLSNLFAAMAVQDQATKLQGSSIMRITIHVGYGDGKNELEQPVVFDVPANTQAFTTISAFVTQKLAAMSSAAANTLATVTVSPS